MSDSSRGRVDLEEMLLPLDQCEPSNPSPSSPPPVPPPEPERPGPPRRNRRGRQEPPPFPTAEAFAEEVIRHLHLRRPELTDALGADVDIATRQIAAATTRLSEAAAEIRETGQALERTATSLSEDTAEVLMSCERQTRVLCNRVKKAGGSFVESAREAGSNIAMARHEMALAAAELKRQVFRYGALLGGATAILVLLAARLLFPFWGMKRSDVEAWSRGTELARTYVSASPKERETILRALGWESMPGVTTPPSASSAPRADGR